MLLRIHEVNGDIKVQGVMTTIFLSFGGVRSKELIFFCFEVEKTCCVRCHNISDKQNCYVCRILELVYDLSMDTLELSWSKCRAFAPPQLIDSVPLLSLLSARYWRAYNSVYLNIVSHNNTQNTVGCVLLLSQLSCQWIDFYTMPYTSGPINTRVNLNESFVLMCQSSFAVGGPLSHLSSPSPSILNNCSQRVWYRSFIAHGHYRRHAVVNGRTYTQWWHATRSNVGNCLTPRPELASVQAIDTLHNRSNDVGAQTQRRAYASPTHASLPVWEYLSTNNESVDKASVRRAYRSSFQSDWPVSKPSLHCDTSISVNGKSESVK